MSGRGVGDGTTGLAGSGPASAGGPELISEMMPDWMRQLVPVLRDVADESAEDDWTRRLHRAVGSLDGEVPFVVVHDWYTRTVAPMLAEPSTPGSGTGDGQEPTTAIARLHVRAGGGEFVGEAEWRAALVPGLRELYRKAYAYTEAFETAYTQCRAYAVANGMGEDEADTYARDYATSSADGNAAAFADANALANAGVLASAYAGADAGAYARTYPSAHVEAYIRFWAAGGPAALRDERRTLARRRLAEGLIGSVTRAASPVRG